MGFSYYDNQANNEGRPAYYTVGLIPNGSIYLLNLHAKDVEGEWHEFRSNNVIRSKNNLVIATINGVEASFWVKDKHLHVKQGEQEQILEALSVDNIRAMRPPKPKILDSMVTQLTLPSLDQQSILLPLGFLLLLLALTLVILSVLATGLCGAHAALFVAAALGISGGITPLITAAFGTVVAIAMGYLLYHAWGNASNQTASPSTATISNTAGSS